MKSWFAANIDTNKGLSGPFSFNHVPATRESGDAPTAPMGGAFCSAHGGGRLAYRKFCRSNEASGNVKPILDIL